MNYSRLVENKKRGTFDFPIELYYVDSASPRYQMPLHWHLEYELILVMEGAFSLSLDGKPFPMGPGDCAWVGDGIVHGGTPQDCVYECVVFDLGTLLDSTPVCAKSAGAFLAQGSGCTGVFPRGSVQAELADRLFEAMEKESPGYEWTTVGLMWQIMGSLLAGRPAQPALSHSREKTMRLKNVLAYIRDNFDGPVTLEGLAKVAGMNPKYFCRAFFQMTGRTPIDYLNYYRIEQAGEQLLLTSRPVTEIALGCGFNDMSYFSRMFSRHKGVSPSRYRKGQAAAPYRPKHPDEWPGGAARGR